MPDNLQLTPATGQVRVNKPTQERRLGTSAFHPPADWPQSMTAVGQKPEAPDLLPDLPLSAVSGHCHPIYRFDHWLPFKDYAFL